MTVLINVFIHGVWVDSVMVWLNGRLRGFSYL